MLKEKIAANPLRQNSRNIAVKRQTQTEQAQKQIVTWWFFFSSLWQKSSYYISILFLSLPYEKQPVSTLENFSREKKIEILARVY